MASIPKPIMIHMDTTITYEDGRVAHIKTDLQGDGSTGIISNENSRNQWSRDESRDEF